MKLPTLSSLINSKQLGKPKESKLLLSLIPALKEKRTQAFTTLALTLATVSFFGLFAISPTLGTIADLQKQIEDSTFVHEKLQQKIANLTTLQQKYQQIQTQLGILHDAIPATLAIDLFVGEAHALAAITNVQVTRVQTFPVDISQTSLTSRFTSYAFSIEIQGSYGNLLNYLTTLGNLNRLVTFDILSLNSVGKIDNTYRMSIRGNVYSKTE